MKTIYKCDVCGKEFTGDSGDWETAYNHEKECRDTHSTGLKLKKDITDVLERANENDIKVGIFCDDPRAYRLVAAEYDVHTKQLHLEIDADDEIGKAAKKTEGANNGNNDE